MEILNTIRRALLFTLFGAVSFIHGQSPSGPDANLPLFELDELEVIHSETEFAPVFGREHPNFSYYDQPDLPNGMFILALDFIDHYREAAVPGDVKWAGILSFPVIHGADRRILKMMVLYFYDNRMWGYDPGATYERDRRFAVPIQFEDRRNREVLYRFASSYVEWMYPGGEEEVYIEEEVDQEDPSSQGAGYYEFFTIEPGRIAPILDSQSGKSGEELVRLIFQYSEPSQSPYAPVELGKGENSPKREKFSWAAFKAEFGPGPDPVEVARELVYPRWSQGIRLRYKQKILGLFETNPSRTVLLFNVGDSILGYDPRVGIWRTRATVSGLDGTKMKLSHINHPDIEDIASVELVLPE